MFILDRFQKLRLIQENNGHRSLAHSLNRTHMQNTLHTCKPPSWSAVMVWRSADGLSADGTSAKRLLPHAHVCTRA